MSTSDIQIITGAVLAIRRKRSSLSRSVASIARAASDAFADSRPSSRSTRSSAAASPSSYKGMHGYFTEAPAMRSSLFLLGPGIARRGNLGEVDMRDIAPSIARILGVTLEGAEGRVVF